MIEWNHLWTSVVVFMCNFLLTYLRGHYGDSIDHVAAALLHGKLCQSGDDPIFSLQPQDGEAEEDPPHFSDERWTHTACC